MRIKNVLLSLGFIVLTAFSLIWLTNSVPRIEYRSAESSVKSIDSLNQGFSVDELRLGDSAKVSNESFCEGYSDDYYSTAINSGCIHVTDSTECNDNGVSASECYICTTCDGYCSGVYLYVSGTSGDWLVTPADSVLNLEYEASCSADTCAGDSRTCSMSGNGCSGDSCKASVSASDARYSSTASTDGGSLNGPILNVETCSPDWTAGQKTRYFKTINTQLEAVTGKLKVYMNGCSPAVGQCYGDNCSSVSLWECGPGQWFSRCNEDPGEMVCEYGPSEFGPGLKYADWYKWTKDVDHPENVAFVTDAECNGCWGNATTLARSSSVFWGRTGPGGYTKLDEQNSSAKCKIIEEPKVCQPTDHDGAPSSNLKVDDKCEGEKYVFYGDGKWCGASGITATGEDDGKVGEVAVYSQGALPFFENKCVTRIGNKFDIEGEDIEPNNTLDIKQGQSIGVEIRSTSIKLCYAKFNSGTWMKAYDLIQQKLTTEESVRAGADIERARYWYKTILKAILDQINEYMDWHPVHKNEPATKFKLLLGSAEQPLDNYRGEKSKFQVDFIDKPCNNGEEGMIDPNDKMNCLKRCPPDSDYSDCVPTFSRCDTSQSCAASFDAYRREIEYDDKGKFLANIEDYGVKYSPSDPQPNLSNDIANNVFVREVWAKPIDLTTVKNFLWFTTQKDILAMIPEDVDTIDKRSGSIVRNGVGIPEAAKFSGYNRIYTDEEIKKGLTYKAKIVVENIGMSKSIVTDELCEFNVLNRDLTYRVIEETNPFINETRKKGYNWYRTGQDGVLYDFTKVIETSGEDVKKYEFNSESIKSIKSSNASNEDAYLGLCYYSSTHGETDCPSSLR